MMARRSARCREQLTGGPGALRLRTRPLRYGRTSRADLRRLRVSRRPPLVRRRQLLLALQSRSSAPPIAVNSVDGGSGWRLLVASGVVQRTRELGTARAVGVRRWYLQRMVLVEALVMGALGLVLGGVVGIALGALWIRWTFPYLLGYVLDFHLPYMQLGLIGLMTALVCAIAAVLPARGAARLEPAVALRYE